MRYNSKNGYPGRGYQERRRSRRIMIAIIIAAVVALALLGVLIGVLMKTKQERLAQQLAYRQEGIAYYEEGNYEKALVAFDNALKDANGEITETEMDICFYKARTQYELGNPEGALETYGAVIAYNNSPKAYFLRGNLYYSMGEEEKAIDDYKMAAEYETKEYELFLSIYEILASKEQVEEGKAILNKALDMKEETAADKVSKGRIHFYLGDHESAIGLLTEAATEDADGYYYLFLVYDAMEHSEKAVDNLNTYLEEAKDINSEKLYEMGSSLLNKEMYESAIECYTKALALEKVPNQQEIMKKLVVTYEKMEDFTSAKEVMAEYVALYPEDEEAYREYLFLQTR